MSEHAFVVAERLTADLYATMAGRRMTLEVGPERRPLLRFDATSGERVDVALVFGGRSDVRVSRSPSTVVSILEEEARRHHRDPAGWSGVVARRIADAATRWGAATATIGGRDLKTVVLGVAHPALVPALAAGMAPLEEVPAWAARPLSRREVRDVAEAFFGPVTTRAVVSSLARVLASPLDGRLRWSCLAVATAAAPRVAPDDVATLLSTPPAPLIDPPDTDDVTRLGQLFEKFDRSVTLRLAREALSGGDALRQLLAAATAATDVGRSIDSERPARLADLRHFAVATARAVVEPAPMIHRADTTRLSWAAPRTAPVALGPPLRGARARTDPLRRALDTSAAGDLVLHVARDAPELQAWAAILDNCLASFADAVATGRSLVVGVRRDGRLIAALEIDPSGPRLRQFVAHRNRQPPPSVTAPVLGRLRDAGVAVG